MRFSCINCLTYRYPHLFFILALFRRRRLRGRAGDHQQEDRPRRLRERAGCPARLYSNLLPNGFGTYTHTGSPIRPTPPESHGSIFRSACRSIRSHQQPVNHAITTSPHHKPPTTHPHGAGQVQQADQYYTGDPLDGRARRGAPVREALRGQRPDANAANGDAAREAQIGHGSAADAVHGGQSAPAAAQRAAGIHTNNNKQHNNNRHQLRITTTVATITDSICITTATPITPTPIIIIMHVDTSISIIVIPSSGR